MRSIDNEIVKCVWCDDSEELRLATDIKTGMSEPTAYLCGSCDTKWREECEVYPDHPETFERHQVQWLQIKPGMWLWNANEGDGLELVDRDPDPRKDFETPKIELYRRYGETGEEYLNRCVNEWRDVRAEYEKKDGYNLPWLDTVEDDDYFEGCLISGEMLCGECGHMEDLSDEDRPACPKCGGKESK